MIAIIVKFRCFFGSVRGRFIWLFFLGMSVTLATASALSYSAMHEAVGQFNHRSAKADLSQITSNIQKLSSEMERQMSMLILDSATHVMMNEDVFTPLEVIEKVREYTDKVSMLITNFPYVHSVYLWKDNGSFWATTQKNMLYFDSSQQKPIDKKIDNLINSSSWTLTMTSGISSNDFPIPYEQIEDLPLISVTKKYSSGVLMFNIKEDELDSTYVGFTSNPENKIRLLDKNGNIFSSVNKSELLQHSSDFTTNMLTQSGEKTDASAAKQFFWQPIPKLGLVVFNEMRLDVYWREWSKIRRMVFLTFFIGLGITCIVFFLWISKVFKPIGKLIANMGQVKKGRYEPLSERKGTDEMSVLIHHYNEMLVGMEQLIDENRCAEAEKRESELKALRSQINPHFLYNTLNTIKWMSLMDGNKKTADCITSLGKIIVPLFKSNSPTCPLFNELEIVEKYIEIMNIRCGGGITFTTLLESGTENLPVPRFILQPIVENSVVHGLAPHGYKGCIEISVKREDGCLILQTSDDGDGMSVDVIEEQNQSLHKGENVQGVGMMNTNRRIQLWYGADYGITLSRSELGGLCATIKIPYSSKELEVDK